MDASDFSLDQLCAELQVRLDHACMRAQIEEACIGVISDSVEQRAVVRPSASHAKPFCIDVGCLAKVLTATLIAQLSHQGRLALEDSVANILPLRRFKNKRVLTRITIRQLLNHTHGLDGTTIHTLPLLTNGYVDTDTLCDQLCSVPLIAKAGSMYNYGTAGTYIAAAILEQVYGQTYEEILIEHLLRPIGAVLRESESPELRDAGDRPRVCPALGGRMAMSIEDIMAFARFHFGDDRRGRDNLHRAAPLRFMFEAIQPLSGWNPLERGVASGWKHYGPGWFGHHANVFNSSVLFRLHLERRLAVIVAVRAPKAEAAFQIFATVFGDVLQEIVPDCVPALLSQGEWSALDAEKFTGLYQNRGSSVTIERRGGSIEMTASFLYNDEVTSMVSPLMPAQHEIFLTGPAVREVFPLLQFLSPRADGKFKYLWNGRHLWRLTPSVSSALQ